MRPDKKKVRKTIRYLLDNSRSYEDYSQKYISLARYLARKIRFRLKKEKIYFCTGCNMPFSSENVRIRFNNHKQTYTCLNCGKIKRVPYKTKKHLNK